MTREQFTVSPIGHVHAGQDGFYLELRPDVVPALRGLDGFSHIQVLWWCHLCADDEYREIMQWDQPYKHGPTPMGVLATRSPLRPNPIALTAVAVLHVDYATGRIDIPYIDAEDGTPVLDIKPYHPSADRVRDASVPAWCRHWPQCVEDSAAFDWSAEFVEAR